MGENEIFAEVYAPILLLNPAYEEAYMPVVAGKGNESRFCNLQAIPDLVASCCYFCCYFGSGGYLINQAQNPCLSETRVSFCAIFLTCMVHKFTWEMNNMDSFFLRRK